MKKSAKNLLFILLVTLGLGGNTFAQAPEGIIYQAEARDVNGNPIRDTRNGAVLEQAYQEQMAQLLEQEHKIRLTL